MSPFDPDSDLRPFVWRVLIVIGMAAFVLLVRLRVCIRRWTGVPERGLRARARGARRAGRRGSLGSRNPCLGIFPATPLAVAVLTLVNLLYIEDALGRKPRFPA